MKFPDHITGPQFSDGDLITFMFDESELTLRAPKVPYNRGTIDKVSRHRDIRNTDLSEWDFIGTEGHCKFSLVVQNWKYEDSVSHDDIAHALLDIDVVKHSEREAESLFALSSQSFKKHFLNGLTADFPDNESDERPYWPTKQNNFLAQPIKREHVDGLQVQLDLVEGKKYPTPCAYFSLGRRYTLRIAFHFGSLHYSDRKNPYSEELLQQFKLDAFDDFLSHIRIEYTPETIALIEKLKREQA